MGALLCIMHGFPTRLVQESNVGTVHKWMLCIVCVYLLMTMYINPLLYVGMTTVHCLNSLC